MDPLSLSPTDEGGASQDILQRRRERERNRREQETVELVASGASLPCLLNYPNFRYIYIYIIGDRS